MTGRTSAASSGKRPNSPAKRGQSAARRSTNNSMSTSDSLDLRQVLSSARLTFESEMKKPKTKQQLLPSPSIGISKRLSSPPSSSGNQTRSNSAPVSPVKLLDSSSAQKRKATRENVSPRGSGSRSAAANAATTAAVTSPKRIKSEPLETNSKRTCPPVSAIVSVKQIRSEQSETSSKRAPSPIETSRPKKKQFELKKLYQDEGVIHLLHSLPTSRRKIQTNHFNPTLKTLGGSSAAPAGSSGHKALQNRTNSPIPSHQTRPTFTHLQQKEPKKNHLLRVSLHESDRHFIFISF